MLGPKFLCPEIVIVALTDKHESTASLSDMSINRKDKNVCWGRAFPLVKHVLFFFFFLDLFIYFRLRWDFIAARGLSQVAVVSGSYSVVAVLGLLIVVASLVVEHGLYGLWPQLL